MGPGSAEKEAFWGSQRARRETETKELEWRYEAEFSAYWTDANLGGNKEKRRRKVAESKQRVGRRGRMLAASANCAERLFLSHEICSGRTFVMEIVARELFPPFPFFLVAMSRGDTALNKFAIHREKSRRRRTGPAVRGVH